MAIYPQYAEAILAGRKQVEFRKRPLAPDVRTVVLYATAPVKKIVGEFTVADTVLASPAQLWSELHHVGGIDRDAYDSYYVDTEMAAGIVLDSATRYRRPAALIDLKPRPSVPQSVGYLPSEILQQLRCEQDRRESLMGRLVRVIDGIDRSVVAPRVSAAPAAPPNSS